MDPQVAAVGELNRGWYQVAVALDFERSGIQTYAGVRRSLEELVAFAGEAFIQCPLTLDRSAVKLFLTTLNPNLVPTPGTMIARASPRSPGDEGIETSAPTSPSALRTDVRLPAP